MKKSTLVLTILVCTLALSFPAATVSTANGLLINEDFESVQPGQIPRGWWSRAYSGEGCFNDKWVRSFESSNVLSLASGWASLAGPASIVLLNYAVEADV